MIVLVLPNYYILSENLVCMHWTFCLLDKTCSLMCGYSIQELQATEEESFQYHYRAIMISEKVFVVR